MVALYVFTFAWYPCGCTSSNKPTARCHWLPFSQAPMVALYVITSAWRSCERFSSNNPRAHCYGLSFPQALMVALFVISPPGVPASASPRSTLGRAATACISRKH